MSYQDDKRELLKLKQGLIEESESVKEEKREVVELHGWKKVSNFFYHYKWHVIAATFFVAVAGFFIYDLVKKEHGDMRVLIVTKENELAKQVNHKTKDFELAFEKYCPDFDDSGYVHVDTYNIDLSENIDGNYMLAGVTKLTGEISYGEAQLYIMDTPALESIITEGEPPWAIPPHAEHVLFCTLFVRRGQNCFMAPTLKPNGDKEVFTSIFLNLIQRIMLKRVIF